jgi:alpha-tubulin suppressor-like RCC1 family protein
MKRKNCWLWVAIIVLALIWPASGAAATRLPVIACGSSHSLAIKADRTLWAWGTNASAQLGLGDYSPYHYTPIKVGNSNNWAAVAGGGEHSLGLRADGTLWSWGYNGQGQLGVGDYNPRTSPTVVGTAKWVAIAAGLSYSLGIRADGTLWSWGANDVGQLGLGYFYGMPNIPTQVGNAKWIAVAASSVGQHSLGLRADGTLWSWGDNGNGQLGLGYFLGSVNIPTQVGTAVGWVTIACGGSHSLGGWAFNTLWTWGYNLQGQLGLNDYLQRNSPTLTGLAERVPAGGYGHSMSIADGGQLYGFGANGDGQLGVGDWNGRIFPTTEATHAKNWVAVAAGRNHTLGLRRDGTLWAWGDNIAGQLGLGDTNDRNTPVKVSGAFFRYSVSAIAPMELLLLN